MFENPLEIQDLTLGYRSNTLLKNVNASFPAGSLTALIGRNGAGKSTLLRAVAGLGRVAAGRVLINGKDSSTLRPSALAKEISYVGTTRVRVDDMRVRDAVALGRAPYTDWIGSLSIKDWETVDESLAKTGMTDFADRRLNSLSDGECQRVMIARALAQQTPIMLLDEPTSFLDLPGRHSICGLLRSLSHSEGKTILFSTHELDIALKSCDNICLVSPPTVTLLPTSEMESSGLLAPLLTF